MGACCGTDRKVFTVEQRRLKEGRPDDSFKFSFKSNKEEATPTEESQPTKSVTIQEPEEEEYQLNRKGFVGTQGKFLAKGPGSVTGSDFLVEKCDTCQLYVHDMMKSCKVNLCQNSSIVLGPIQSLCQVDIVNDSKMIVFCDQIKIRDCHNLEIMLCSPNPVS